MARRFLLAAVALFLLGSVREEAHAQVTSIAVEVPRSFAADPRTFSERNVTVFSVKYLCGTVAANRVSPPAGTYLTPGSYLTAINVHNLGASPAFVHFAVNGTLVFDMAITSVTSFDCRNIAPPSINPGSFVSTDPFSEGFVSLFVLKGGNVNVVAVYTAGP